MNSSNKISDNNLLSMPFELYPEILKYIDNPNTVAHVCKLFYAILYSDSHMYNHYSKEVNSLLGGTVKLIENPEKFSNLLCLKKTILSQAVSLDRKMVQCSRIFSVMKINPYSYDIFALSERFECYNSFPIFYDNFTYFDKIFYFTFYNNYVKCTEKIICYLKGKSINDVSVRHYRLLNYEIRTYGQTYGMREIEQEFLPHLLSLDKSMLDEYAIAMALKTATTKKHKDLIQILLPLLAGNDRFVRYRNKAIECLKSMETPEKPNRN